MPDSNAVPTVRGTRLAGWCALLLLALLAATCVPAQAAGAPSPDPAFLVKDLNPATQDTPLANLTMMGATLFFTAYDGEFGLWRSDGTAADTPLLKHILGSISDLTPVNSKLFFVGDDGTHGRELWMSDGTAAGTTMVRDLTPGDFGPAPANLTELNGALFFTLTTTTGAQLWRSDGTSAGTLLVKQFPGQSIFGPKNVNGQLIFILRASATEVWKSNGTAAGTVRVKILSDFANLVTRAGPALGPPDPYPHNLTSVGKQLFFSSAFSGLWVSDGTANGTKPVQAFASDEPASLTGVDGVLFFLVGKQLWRSDGTPAGTQLLSTHTATPISLFNANGTLYFRVPLGQQKHDFQLWKSNGTPASTLQIRSFTSAAGDQPNVFDTSSFASLNGHVFFAADDGASGLELWQTDGTAAGTARVKDINPDGDSTPRLLTSGAGQIFFAAYDNISGAELWRSDGTTAGTRMVKDIQTQPADSNPTQLADVNGKLFFTASSDNQHDELWRSDGTPAGTMRVISFFGSTAWPDGRIDLLSSVNGNAIFSVDTSPGDVLWSSDGTPAGTQQLLPWSTEVESTTLLLSNMVSYNGQLYFLRVTYAGDLGLWRTDGSAAGTRLVKTIANAAETVGRLALLGGTLFFTSDIGTSHMLWQSNGTEGGTTPVATVSTDPAARLVGLIAAGSRLFFALQDSSAAALWTSDGTTGGTAAVAPLPSNATFHRFTNANGRLFFAAYGALPSTDISTTTLWTSDGTAGGTAAVRNDVGVDLFPETPLPIIGSTVFFAAFDAATGAGLWRSDGTAAGTQLLKTIGPIEAGVVPRNLSVAANTLFFSADDGLSGSELWRSDGTTVGTRLVEDIQPGAVGSNPGPVILSGGYLFFKAYTVATGAELWAIRTSTGVDTYVWSPDATFAAPGGQGAIVVRYANRGIQTASGLTLSITLDPALQYIGDDSGVVPGMSGNTLTWHLPNAGLLDVRTLHVVVHSPAAPLGTRYPVTIALSSAEPDAAPADNSASTVVQLARQMFVPLMRGCVYSYICEEPL